MAAQSKDLLARDTYLNLIRVHDRLTAEFVALFRAAGLTMPQYNILRIVIGGPRDGVACQHVSERLITRVPDVTRLLDRMEVAGLVKRSRSSEDRRVVRVVATARGRKLCLSLSDPVMELHRSQFAGISMQAMASLNEGLLELLGKHT